MLQAIAAILSLLLLAGVFGSSTGADGDAPGTSTGSAVAGEVDFEGMP